MRKSIRIKTLEIEILRLGAQVDLLSETLLALIDIRKIEAENLESGKWYNKGM